VFHAGSPASWLRQEPKLAITQSAPTESTRSAAAIAGQLAKFFNVSVGRHRRQVDMLSHPDTAEPLRRPGCTNEPAVLDLGATVVVTRQANKPLPAAPLAAAGPRPCVRPSVCLPLTAILIRDYSSAA